jgi:hypothetical protein
MKLRAPPVTLAYVALTLVFLALAWTRQPYGEGLRFPSLVFVRDPAQSLGGLVPGGLWQLDQARLRSSIARIWPVRLARETGNSIRLAAGQTVEWIVWGGREPLMLFPNIDLWVSRGLTPPVEDELRRAAAIIAEMRTRLQAEGWSLIVVPVPVKLGIHRELSHWPVRESSLVSRDPILEDRSDEFYGFFIDALARRHVDSVDLQTLYRDELKRRPGAILYVPSDSHWSGDGIRLAAEATAHAIASHTPIRERMPVNPTFYEFDYVGDLAKAFDPLPRFTSRLEPAWIFHERLMNGESGRGYVYAQKPTALVVAVGTSYTGQYTWIDQPVSFAWQLGLHLHDTEVQSRPMPGKGSFYAFDQFWKQRNQISRDFASRNGERQPKVVVWEFPIRDVRSILTAPKFD